ncbi:MAG: hypothetical protein JO285_00685, partial [Kutzneria sp.]|nr:hypothetical protein [Kutzneria sp.]
MTRSAAQERYRHGERRSSAQPLTASWEPELAAADSDWPPGKGARRPRSSRGGRYGRETTTGYRWRVYALPVLIVATALVVFNAVRGPSSTVAANSPTTTGEPPVATEGAVQPVDPTSGTAVLPPGGP